MGKVRIYGKKVRASILIPILLLSVWIVFPVSASSSWSKPRPSSPTPYDEVIGNAYTDGIASIGVGVHIGTYYENDPILGDFLTVKVSASANSRKGIQYSCQWPSTYNWYDVSDPTGITEDNSGVNLTLPFPVLLYGVEYFRVWVCDNGFLSFDSQFTNSTPANIPNTDPPNSLVAPFWRDLNPAAGGSITCGYINQHPYSFVISWNNVPNKGNGALQTFQVVIRERPGGSEFHNTIFFQYKSITKDYPTTVGVEDQVGDKGTSFDYNNLYNESCLECYVGGQGCRLEQLQIRLVKIDTDAKIEILENDVGGYNVVLKSSTNPHGSTYAAAIKFAAGQLISKVFGGCAGIMFGILLIVGDYSGILSANLSEPDLTPEDADEWEILAYVTGIARDELYSQPPFDSTLAANVLWKFLDPNDEDHFVIIYADAWYRNLDTGIPYAISTSVTLNMYINQPPAIPSAPSGPTSGYVSTTYTYSTSTTDPEGDSIQYRFDWGDGTDTTTGSYPSDSTATASHSWISAGTYYIKARAKDDYGAWSDWSPSLAIIIRCSLTVETHTISGYQIRDVKVWVDGGLYYSPIAVAVDGGTHTVEAESDFVRGAFWYTFDHWENGSTSNPRSVNALTDMTVTAYYNKEMCPTLFVWNGTEYIYETLLNIHAESDVTVQHQIQQPLALDGLFYKLQLRELDNYTSHIDQVKLYAVDNGGEWHLCPLTSAKLEDAYVTRKLLFDDNKRVDLTPSETINLKFLPSIPYNQTAYFIFEINGYNKKDL